MCLPCKKNKTKIGVCEVCSLVNGDLSKKKIYFCSLCSAWICKDCKPKYKDRAIAAMKKFLI